MRYVVIFFLNKYYEKKAIYEIVGGECVLQLESGDHSICFELIFYELNKTSFYSVFEKRLLRMNKYRNLNVVVFTFRYSQVL